MHTLLKRAFLAPITSRLASRHCTKLWEGQVIGHSIRTITTVQTLKSWDVADFRRQAFASAVPAVLPVVGSDLPPATKKWFVQHSHVEHDRCGNTFHTPKLDEDFWSKYSDLVVPLEITRLASGSVNETEFDRIEAPLSILFASLESDTDPAKKGTSVYLAQHDLRDLPKDLQEDLPTPELVQHAGNGDLYSSSLWLGKSPTYTPLHRDPNPNLLQQLAGTKIIRLFNPEIGSAVFEHVQQLVAHQRSETSLSAIVGTTSASFRGEEMMNGVERTILHDLVWAGTSDVADGGTILRYAQDATLNPGQALFIPKGWWHSVKGVGDGVTASANWWFR